MVKYILVCGGVISYVYGQATVLTHVAVLARVLSVCNSTLFSTLTDFISSSSDRLNVTASSTGLLLKTAGYKVTSIKIDPYMNIDAGTMAPTEHGEFWNTAAADTS